MITRFFGLHKIKYNKEQKPKTFYEVKVFFQQQKSKKKGNAEVEVNLITLEKVYGDFRRLHDYIIETFNNEVAEYERFEQMQAQEQSMEVRSLSLAKQSDLEDPEENIIIMNEGTSEEIYSFGKHYYQEAKRILSHLPRLPPKYAN